MKKLIALLLALTLLLCACASQEASAPTAGTVESTEATEETQIVPQKKDKSEGFGLSYLPEYGVNPYTCHATVNRVLISLLYEGMFTVNNQFRAEPVLCESFKMYNEGRSYVFTIDPTAKFSDGSPVTAKDVEACIDAGRASGIYMERLSHIDYYTVQEDGTLLIHVETPYENLPLVLDLPIVKASTVNDPFPIGSGPYVIAGESLVRNTNWNGVAAPAIDLDTIRLSSCESTGDLRDNFEFGSTDLIYCDPNSPASVGYRCDYEVWEAPTTILHYIGFNLYSGYFANDTLRRAVTYAIDREDIASKIYGGFALPSVLPCSPYSDLCDPKLEEAYGFAPAKFDAGLKDSRVLVSEEYEYHQGIFLVCSDDPTRVEAAEYIAQVLNDAGLRIVVSAVDHDTYMKKLDKGDFDLYYGETRMAANFDLKEFFSKYGNLMYGSIKDSALVDMCYSALESTGKYVDLSARVMEQAPICAVVFKSYAIYVTRGKLVNITPSVDNAFHDAASARSLADADKTYEGDEE
ncbi:MAG: ABC transporter substrate-binding protein [Oscillospiraceae bacterium]|nr:ABC transporter substrate-binding protein [Oscillospiraceae bacterium]